jgi:aspartyl-tRNA(Asn)/glutamyl-tRNA(Gln) amidotransferase subunit A
MDAAVMAGIPALAVPGGFSTPQNGIPALPIGLQIMGAQWQESTILRAAYSYEQATEWHTMTPPL